MWSLCSGLWVSLGCQWEQSDECGVFAESLVERTELGAVLLQDELVYPMAEHNEDEYCCYPAPG
jgi:hypothetical protein